MIKSVTRFCVLLSCIFGCEKASTVEIYPFSLQRQDGTVLEGYFSPPSTSSSPIICAIQGSWCESALKWHMDLCEQVEPLGLGLIVIEKQGISKDEINLFEYNQTNCLQHRLEDYTLCLENLSAIALEWEGKIIFWGESEGGLLAASLAAQTPKTAAVLLFATGGGMNPCEEVKWMIHRRLKEHGASQDEIDEYMHFLENQMSAMILDPTPNKYFLGNTYKWWTALLTAHKALTPLNQLSLPIYLVHGVEDNKIPILSADLAAEVLIETKALTYLRLEGYGHDLNTARIQSAACEWLKSILCGQESPGSSLITTTTQVSEPLSVDWKTDINSYVFSRGKGNVSVSAEGKTDLEGNERAAGRVSVSKETDNRVKVEGSVEASGSKDRNGNVKGEVKVEAKGSWGF